MWRFVGGLAMARKTTRTSLFIFLVMTGWLAALASPAGAVTYAKFYNGTDTYGGPFSGSGTIYSAISSMVLSTNCPSTGCTTDQIASSITFLGVPITATANDVWADLSPNYGGLGVGSGSPSDTDQIAGNDVLTLTFTSIVKLTGVGTLFDSGHKPFGTNFQTPSSITGNIGFQVSTDNGATWQTVSFSGANAMSLALIGSTFEFMQESGNPEFYVSALSYDVTCGPLCGNQRTTPIPGALPLFATGLGGLGLLGWRRKRKNAVALAAA
jgi:hypothetical protein